MKLSETNREILQNQIENNNGFDIAIIPVFPRKFPATQYAADKLYSELLDNNISVLMDDRNQRPRNSFEVIEFLKVRHRVVISGRSISAGVYEYTNLQSNEFCKIPEQDMVEFLLERVG